MTWNPEVYEKFKAERSLPFFDLLSLVDQQPNLKVIDLGCGTGELTQYLVNTLLNATVIGLDESKTMLAKTNILAPQANLSFIQRTVQAEAERPEQYDLIFSNACLQWLPDHAVLYPKLIKKLRPAGQLAIQIPSNHDFVVHQLLRQLIVQEPFYTASQHFSRPTSVLTISEYAKILYEQGGKDIQVFEKVYPHVLHDANAVFDWALGTTILPYLDSLPSDMRPEFELKYRQALQQALPGSPVFYPFKRILLHAKF